VRRENTMAIAKGKWVLVVPSLLAFAWGIAVWAQGTAPEKPSAAKVPPKVAKKAREYKGSPTPPKTLVKQADGHWTPYTPPKPEKGEELYTIKKGDTLSELAQEKLGDWLLWPQIWDLNPYIKDAHWIYPGDPLLIRKPQVISEKMPVEKAPPPPPEKKQQGPKLEIEEEAALPPVTANDVYCSGFVSSNFRMPALRIVSGPERVRESLATGNVVYLNGGTENGVQNGDIYFVIRKGSVVHHPETGHVIGTFYGRVGRVKVISAQKRTAIAQIIQSCDEIRYGFGLVPFHPIPIPWDIKASKSVPVYLPDDHSKPKGRIIWTKDRRSVVGQHYLIYINLGSNQGLLPGDKLWIYRHANEEDSLITSTRDLFRQDQVVPPGRDLFREKSAMEKAIRRDSREPKAGSYSGQEVSSGDHESASKDTRYPANQGRHFNPINAIKDYLGEAVVLTTRRNTACCKILISPKESHVGDWVELE
jgi:LysM repeat protein